MKPKPKHSGSKRRSGSAFWFDEEAADRAVQFFERCLTHVKGELAGQPLKLDPWEKERIIRPLLGWTRKDGTRQYRVLYAELPRKQGKSTLSAGILSGLDFRSGSRWSTETAAIRTTSRLG